MAKSKNLIGLAGEYYVCAELCRFKILALIAPKNNPLFDVVAINPESKRTVSIQVKTMSIENNQGWRLGLDVLKEKGNPLLFMILVNMNLNGTNDFYIYEYDAFSKRVQENRKRYMEIKKKDGTSRKEPAFAWFDFKDFIDSDKARKNKWGLLGF